MRGQRERWGSNDVQQQQQQQQQEEEEGERDSFRDGDSWQALVERDVATRGTVAFQFLRSRAAAVCRSGAGVGAMEQSNVSSRP